MLADQLDYIIGVDPHRDSHALAVVHVQSGAVVFEAMLAASSEYRHWNPAAGISGTRMGFF
jgi:hypothetical protein